MSKKYQQGWYDNKDKYRSHCPCADPQKQNTKVIEVTPKILLTKHSLSNWIQMAIGGGIAFSLNTLLIHSHSVVNTSTCNYNITGMLVVIATGIGF